MDYRRRDLRRLANLNQENQKEDKIIVNKIEQNNNPGKVEETTNIQNMYLQRLLVKNKNNTQINSPVNEPSEATNIPSISNHNKDILSNEENKKKVTRYVMHKRNDDKIIMSSPTGKLNSQEENNPSLSNNYFKNYNNNLNPNIEKSHNDMNNNTTKNPTSVYFVRKNKNNYNFDENNNNEHENNNNNKKDNLNTYFKKRFQVSASASNIVSNKGENDDNSNNRSIFLKKNKQSNSNINDNKDNQNINVSKDQNKIQTRYKSNKLIGIDQNEDNKSKEKLTNSIPVNLKNGYRFSSGKFDEASDYDIKVNRKRSKDIEEKNKINDFVPAPINKRYTYVREKYKKGDSSDKIINIKKEKNKNFTKENVSEFKILSNYDTINNNKFKRKYGRFSSNNDINSNENLSFKDEKEIINYINRKYKQNKIMELFNIKKDENKNKIEEELNDLKNKLNEEIKKNKRQKFN